MTDETISEMVAAIAASRRYRGVDSALVRRIAVQELSRSTSPAEAVKRVKRRLHQVVGAYRPVGDAGVRVAGDLDRLRIASKDASGSRLRAVCRELLGRHASTRERLPYLGAFYAHIWELTDGAPAALLDLGCGLAPLSLPWMGLARDAFYRAVDVDAAQLALVDGFLGLVGQPHAVETRDLAVDREVPIPATDVAMLLKLVPILDRQDPAAAVRLLRELDASHAAVSFPAKSLGGRGKGMEQSYRRRMEALADDLGPRVTGVAEASVANELVFVLRLAAAPTQPYG